MVDNFKIIEVSFNYAIYCWFLGMFQHTEKYILNQNLQDDLKILGKIKLFSKICFRQKTPLKDFISSKSIMRHILSNVHENQLIMLIGIK